MKILLFSDVHWSERASIVTKFAVKYTDRLEMLLNSLNWVNKLAIEENCNLMICAGDMMDKSNCTDMELTALCDIKWNKLPCYFLCGNHESSVASLEYSTVKALESDLHFIVETPTKLDIGSCELCFLPYLQDDIRKPLVEYFGKKDKPRIIVSHNDLNGINYGGFVSKSGVSIEEIENNADLYLNGHLHNSEFITEKILNLGSLSAHNFTNDSARYKYGCWILDTDTLALTFFENPHAFNFYQFEISSGADLNKLDTLKNNAVISIICKSNLISRLRTKIEEIELQTPGAIIAKRILTMQELVAADESELDITDLTIDYLQELCTCCKNKLDNTATLDWVLSEICK